MRETMRAIAIIAARPFRRPAVPVGASAAAMLLLVQLAWLVGAAHADQPRAPGPLGFWALEGNQGVVEIYSCGWQTLCGALVGIEFDHPTDPMPMTWDHRSQCDFPFIANLRRRGDDWFGTITNPKSGHSYGARLSMESPGVLKLRGYFLIPTLGQTQTWTRFPGTPPSGCRMTPSDFSNVETQ
jgi:uncharacterized protein (DUF2147 family)